MLNSKKYTFIKIGLFTCLMIVSIFSLACSKSMTSSADEITINGITVENAKYFTDPVQTSTGSAAGHAIPIDQDITISCAASGKSNLKYYWTIDHGPESNITIVDSEVTGDSTNLGSWVTIRPTINDDILPQWGIRVFAYVDAAIESIGDGGSKYVMPIGSFHSIDSPNLWATEDFLIFYSPFVAFDD